MLNKRSNITPHQEEKKNIYKYKYIYKEGRWIKGQTKWNNLDIPVASVYAPNNSYDRAYFFYDMSDWIISDSSIIGGDFNCNIDNVKIKDGSKTILKNVINEKDLCDVWRTIHPDKAGYTHYHKASKQATRIDYLFLSSNLLSNVLDVRVNPHGNSDHSIVCMKLHDPGMCMAKECGYVIIVF